MRKGLLILTLLLGVCLFTYPQTKKNTQNKPEEPDIVYNYYTIVVGSFGDAINAKKYADKVNRQGFDPYFRKNDKGYYRVCVYRLSTEKEAEDRLKKLKNIDYIFFKGWILGYDRISENINYGQL